MKGQGIGELTVILIWGKEDKLIDYKNWVCVWMIQIDGDRGKVEGDGGAGR
jgi:hypothetical protein